MTEQLISTHVTLSQLNELDVLRIQNQQANASIALQGAHIFEYAAVNGRNLLFTSQVEPFSKGKPIRGGIPICWPWFGPHEKESEAPAHGFVRNQLWQYEVVSDSEDRTDIKFWLETDGSDIGFHHKARVELLASIGRTLVVSLTTINLDENPFLISQALHTYFNCDDIEQVRLHGLHGVCYFDKVTDENQYFPSDFTFNQETDWVLREQGNPVGISGTGGQTLKLSRIGSQSLVVWNPWIEKSKHLSQFMPDEYQRMFCVETANASEDSRLIKPNQSHVMLMELSEIETH